MKVSVDGKIAFEVFGVDLENIALRVSSVDQEIAVKLAAESLLELMDRLRFAVESVISELNSPSA